jgi:hypothetical protein
MDLSRRSFIKVSTTAAAAETGDPALLTPFAF